MWCEQKGYVYNFLGVPCAGLIQAYKFFDPPLIKGEVLISAVPRDLLLLNRKWPKSLCVISKMRTEKVADFLLAFSLSWIFCSGEASYYVTRTINEPYGEAYVARSVPV